MSETTQIHPDKVRAYLATDYRLGHTDQDIVLNIGKRSERLAALFAASGVACGAFLTAYNPRGAIQSDEANERGHAELAHYGQLRDEGENREAGASQPCGNDRAAKGQPPGDRIAGQGQLAETDDSAHQHCRQEGNVGSVWGIHSYAAGN